MLSRVKAGKQFMTLEADEEPLTPALIGEDFDHVALLSSNGKLLVFALDQLRELAKGRGIILMRPDHGEKVIAIDLATADRIVVRGANRAGKEMTVTIQGDELAKYKLHRGRKGWRIAHRIRPSGLARQV